MTKPIGTSNPIQSDFACLVCCIDDLMPGRIQKITPSTITPNKRLSQVENSMISLYICKLKKK